MPNYRLLTLTAWMLLALYAGAQPKLWHKIIRETPICVPFCHVLAEGDHFLVSTDRHIQVIFIP